MKKTLFALLFALLCLCSCSENKGEQVSPKSNVPFSCTAKINHGSLSFSANFTFRNSASASLEFLSPSEVEGLIFELSGSEVLAKYKGLSFTLPKSNSGVYSAARLIFTSLSSADSKENSRRGDGDFEISSSIEGVDYSLIFDGKSGILKSLNVPSLSFITEFENFAYLY